MYTLRFPFNLPLGQEIAVIEESRTIDNLDFSLKEQGGFYILTVDGFSSEEEAKRYINNIWAGLMWVLLHKGLSPKANLGVQKVKYVKDPVQAARNLLENNGLPNTGPVDALIGNEGPVVYLTEKNLRTISTIAASVVIITSATNVFESLSEGVSFSESSKVVDDVKLRLALELYGAFFVEISSNSRFLTLVMSLEALAIGIVKTPLVLDLLNKWMSEVDNLIEEVDSSSDDASSLEALSRELSFRKEDSIRRQIRNIVRTTLQEHGDKDAEEVAKRALKMYDHRSKLIHEGTLDRQILNEVIPETKNIVERVLRARFFHTANC